MENEIQNRNEQIQALAEHLLKTENMWSIALRLSEFLIKEKERKPDVRIAVSPEEWEAIQGLFRIRGTRVNGQEERRGRPKKL